MPPLSMPPPQIPTAPAIPVLDYATPRPPRFPWRTLLQLAICIVLGALLGAAIGRIVAPKPVYASFGLIEAKPNMPGAATASAGQWIQGYTQSVQSLSQILTGPQVIAAAMNDPVWRGTAPSTSTASFTSRLSASYISNSALIQVRFTDASPQAAQAAVGSVIRAFQSQWSASPSVPMSVQIISYGNMPLRPFMNRTKQFTVLGALLGAAAGILLDLALRHRVVFADASLRL